MKKKFFLAPIAVVMAVGAAFSKKASAIWFTDEYLNHVSIDYYMACSNITTEVCGIKWINGSPAEYRYHPWGY